MPWHAKRAPGASDRANESTMDHGHRPWSARVPGWLVGRLRLGVGQAGTVRPEHFPLGVVGERGSRHESCSQLVPGSAGQKSTRYTAVASSLRLVLGHTQ